MISRGLVLVGTVAAAAYVAVVVHWYRGSPLDRIELVFALKLLLVLVIALHFLWTDGRRLTRALATLRALCERRPALCVATLIAVGIAASFATTPQIAFGEGALGVGYGHDGAIYGTMTEHFAWFKNPGMARFGYRFFAPMLVHYSGLDTFTGYRLLDLVSGALATVLMYRIARDLALAPAAAVLGAALFLVLKFGLKFFVYYPVLTDALGLLLLMAIIWATLEGRPVVYLLAMAAAVGTRENLIVLTVFNALYTLRTAKGSRRFLDAALLQIPALAVFALSRRYPVFPPFRYPGSAFDIARRGVEDFVSNPTMQWMFILSYVNALGIFAILPLLFWRRFTLFLRERYEWAYYVVVSVALSTAGGVDFDRYAVPLAPIAILGMLALTVPADGRIPRLWLYWLAVHVVSMEFIFPWFPEEGFYMSRCAAHAKGLALTYIADFSWVLAAVTFALALHDRASEAAT